MSIFESEETAGGGVDAEDADLEAATGEGADLEDDTSDDTSEGTSDDTSEGTSDDEAAGGGEGGGGAAGV